MKNLFKYAAEHWKALLLIIAVLFIQAYCDLSLPAYTSDIVNVGIQQGGVEDQVPEQISVEEMDRLLLFVPSDEQQTVLDSYTPGCAGGPDDADRRIRVRKRDDRTDRRAAEGRAAGRHGFG